MKNLKVGMLALSILVFQNTQSSMASTEQKVEALGNFLIQAPKLFAPVAGADINNYMLEPVSKVGSVLLDFRPIKGLIEEMQLRLSNISTLVACSKLKAETIAKFALPDDQLTAAELKGKKLCAPVGCKGNKLSCMKEAFEDFHFIISTLQKILLGEKGLGVRLFGVVKQDAFYNDIEKKYIDAPLAQVEDLLTQLITLLGVLVAPKSELSKAGSLEPAG